MFCTISQLLVNITTVLGDERDSSTCCGFFFKGDATNCSPDTVRLAGAMEHTAALTLMLKLVMSMMTVMMIAYIQKAETNNQSLAAQRGAHTRLILG